MCAKVVYKVFLLLTICLITLNSTKANPLQHLAEIDLQDISPPRTGKQYVANDYEQDEVENDSDESMDEIKAITAEQVQPIISGMLGQLGTAIQPLLGPLAPLSNVLGPMITSTVTDLVTGLLNRVAESANRNEFAQNSGYDTYMVNIPNQGSYILLSKSPSNNQQVQKEPPKSSYVGTLDEFLAAHPNSKGSSNNAYYHGKRPSGVALKKKIKKIKTKEHTYVVPLKKKNTLRNLSDSRSGSPLSDYDFEYV